MAKYAQYDFTVTFIGQLGNVVSQHVRFQMKHVISTGCASGNRKRSLRTNSPILMLTKQQQFHLYPCPFHQSHCQHFLSFNNKKTKKVHRMKERKC